MSRFPQPIGGSGAAMPTTPGNDPIDSLSQPRAAAAPHSSGPHRTPRCSPSPLPYGRGGETPRASRMSSASDAALRQGCSRSSPPHSTPGSHRGASPISLGGGPDDDDMGDDNPPLVGSRAPLRWSIVTPDLAIGQSRTLRLLQLSISSL